MAEFDKLQNILYALQARNLVQIYYHIKNGLRLDLYDEEKEPFLLHAAKNGYYDVVNLLLDCGADVDIEDRWHHTAIYSACDASRVNLFKDPAMPPTDYYPENDALITVAVLATRGASISFLNNRNPFLIACKKGYTKILRFLIEYPFMITPVDKIKMLEEAFIMINGIFNNITYYHMKTDSYSDEKRYPQMLLKCGEIKLILQDGIFKMKNKIPIEMSPENQRLVDRVKSASRVKEADVFFKDADSRIEEIKNEKTRFLNNLYGKIQV